MLPRTVGTVPGRAEVHNEVFVIAWRSQVHARAAALPESPELLRKYASASILQAVMDKGHPMHAVSSARAVNVLHAHRAPPRVKQANTVCDPQTMMRKQRVADGIVYEFVAGMAHDAPLDCGRGQVFKTNRLWRKTKPKLSANQLHLRGVVRNGTMRNFDCMGVDLYHLPPPRLCGPRFLEYNKGAPTPTRTGLSLCRHARELRWH